MWLRNFAFFLLLLSASFSFAADADLVSVEKIWDQGPHNAFTDLIRFKDHWYCCFRESDAHVGGDGKCRVLTSADGKTWDSAALVAEKGVDLRDPKLSITADGRLMMVLADVAGKGLASAMISMTFRSSFRAICGAGLPMHEMAARLNQLHWQEGTEARRRYVTAILLSLNPARILGVTGGSLSEGAPADITIIAPDLKVRVDASRLRSKSKNTPFDGWELRGGVAATLVVGRP